MRHFKRHGDNSQLYYFGVKKKDFINQLQLVQVFSECIFSCVQIQQSSYVCYSAPHDVGWSAVLATFDFTTHIQVVGFDIKFPTFGTWCGLHSVIFEKSNARLQLTVIKHQLSILAKQEHHILSDTV